MLSGTPAYTVFPYRQGRVITFYNNPVFRAYWWGTNKMVANALFFNKAMRFGASREQ